MLSYTIGKKHTSVGKGQEEIRSLIFVEDWISHHLRQDRGDLGLRQTVFLMSCSSHWEEKYGLWSTQSPELLGLRIFLYSSELLRIQRYIFKGVSVNFYHVKMKTEKFEVIDLK